MAARIDHHDIVLALQHLREWGPAEPIVGKAVGEDDCRLRPEGTRTCLCVMQPQPVDCDIARLPTLHAYPPSCHASALLCDEFGARGVIDPQDGQVTDIGSGLSWSPRLAPTSARRLQLSAFTQQGVWRRGD